VLLLRLRQLCSHPCLIQEGGDASIRPENETVKYQSQTELDRATILAGEEFVSTMKAKFKAIALERMAAEQASYEAVIDAEDCPVSFQFII
jgi:SNF2 family DNA or RNA helicase